MNNIESIYNMLSASWYMLGFVFGLAALVWYFRR